MKDKTLDLHLFICTNLKKNGEGCASKNAVHLRDAVQEECKRRFDSSITSKKIRINAAGCLGHCEEGIAAVLYPEGEWITNLKESDSLRLVAKIEEKV